MTVIDDGDALAYVMSFSTAQGPIDDHLPKLGGGPAWLDDPQSEVR